MDQDTALCLRLMLELSGQLARKSELVEAKADLVQDLQKTADGPPDQEQAARRNLSKNARLLEETDAEIKRIQRLLESLIPPAPST